VRAAACRAERAARQDRYAPLWLAGLLGAGIMAAYVIALKAPQSIFELAIQYAFSGYTALAPLIVAALFWRRSTKWGALACALWAIASVLAVAVFQALVPAPAPGPPVVVWAPGGIEILTRTAGGTAILGLMPVVPMALISALLMIVVSLLTAKPSAAAIGRYFAQPTPVPAVRLGTKLGS
jgi:SSS family solute:Na+ symporter